MTLCLWRRAQARLSIGIVLITTVALSGCGKKAFETAPVHGTITVDGKPLTVGKINFVPEKGRSATGQVQADGTYKLGTYTDTDGAMIGKHRVAIDTRKPILIGETAAESDEPASKPPLPARYAIEANSGLTFEVKAGQDNVADFKLNSQ